MDVRRAYFYAKASRPIHINIPAEYFCEGDEDKVARLDMSLYGTRDAGLNWFREVTETLLSLGFCQGHASTCYFATQHITST